MNKNIKFYSSTDHLYARVEKVQLIEKIILRLKPGFPILDFREPVRPDQPGPGFAGTRVQRHHPGRVRKSVRFRKDRLPGMPQRLEGSRHPH